MSSENEGTFDTEVARFAALIKDLASIPEAGRDLTQQHTNVMLNYRLLAAMTKKTARENNAWTERRLAVGVMEDLGESLRKDDRKAVKVVLAEVRATRRAELQEKIAQNAEKRTKREAELLERIIQNVVEGKAQKAMQLAAKRVERPPFEVFFARTPASTTEQPSPLPRHDLVISTNKIEFVVHREVLNAQSDYFRVMSARSHEDLVPVHVKANDQLPLTILHLLRFCYKGTYDIHATFDARIITESKQPQQMLNAGALRIHAWVCLAAEKYAMPALRALAIEAFKAEVSGKLERTWTEGTAHYKTLARRLAAVTIAVSDRLPFELLDFIIEIWQRDDSKLACCYLEEDHFYQLLLAVPDLAADLTVQDELDHDCYEDLRSRKKERYGTAEERSDLFKHLGLHTPADEGWWREEEASDSGGSTGEEEAEKED